MDEILVSRARLNQTSIDFLKVDVQTALTFCDIAESENLRKRLRNRRNARQGYETILRLMDNVTLTEDDAQYLAENLEKLRVRLVNLGEFL